MLSLEEGKEDCLILRYNNNDDDDDDDDDDNDDDDDDDDADHRWPNLNIRDKRSERDSRVSAYKVVSAPAGFAFVTQRTVTKFSVSMAFWPKFFKSSAAQLTRKKSFVANTIGPQSIRDFAERKA